jgi:dethiobiotin synthetase
MRISGYFISATDTAVGKTTFTAALAAALTRQGRRVLAAKPVESGDGGDAERIAQAAHHPPLCVYRFSPPVAPGVAAEQAQVTISFETIEEQLAERARSQPPDLLLVEGAGGLLCPLGGTRTIADLAQRLALPLLLVARSGLGTINHTLLTVSEARRRGLAIAGVILNQVYADRTPDELTNAAMIARLSGVPVLHTIDHQPGPTPSIPPLPDSLLQALAPRPSS